MRKVVLIGPMAVGKTTVGRLLANELGWRFVDSDRQLYAATGHSAREIAEDLGVDGLHTMELEMLGDALTAQEPAVIAAAASVIDDADARDELGTVDCVRLTADKDVLHTRIAGGLPRRGVAAGEDLARRADLFAEVADVTVDTTRSDPADCVKAVRAALGL
ncbi:MAG: shikimate kinase [Acidimicrobiia bacterium]